MEQLWLCEDQHDELCFAGEMAADCPACQAIDNVNTEMGDRIAELEKHIEELEKIGRV